MLAGLYGLDPSNTQREVDRYNWTAMLNKMSDFVSFILTKITGKKCICPSGFVCVSLKYTRTGKLGHQSSQFTNVEYL